MEKGRTLPPWLPPDPKAPTAAPRMVATQASLQQGGYGQPAVSAGSRGGGLGDLWGDSGASQPPPPSHTASLRNRAAVSPRPTAASIRPQQPPTQSYTAPSLQPTARPLPSQRAGSYQTTASAQQGRFVPERTGSSGSAQERLRARLNGGASPSPPARGRSPGGQPQMGSSRPWEQNDPAGFDGGYGASAYGGGGESVGRRPVGLPAGPRPKGAR
jgi:hypothetical protein